MTTRTVIRWIGSIASSIWIILTIYQEFFEVDPDQYSFRSPEVAAKMKACGGDFHQRYECKEALMLAKGRASFLIWMRKVAVIFGPPFALALLLHLANQNRRPKPSSDYFSRRPTPITKRRVR